LADAFQRLRIPEVLMRYPRNPQSSEPERAECVICADNLPVTKFYAQRTTEDCNHDPQICLDCIRDFIHIGLETKIWTDLRCPECSSNFTHADIQRLAYPADFIRYDALSSNSAISSLPEFRWCLAGCGSGQLHADEGNNPLMECTKCGHRQCYTHNVAWHTDLTCEEYDEFLANPDTFQSRLDIDNQRAADEGARDAESAREREDRQRRMSEEADRTRREMTRRRDEENESKNVITATTRPCPSCKWRIQKIDGW
jgi:DNA-directed RNA polymerase subunit RPC12/RpoP